MELSISSSAFQDRGTIPKKYTGDGRDISPPLDWRGIPDEAKSLALVCNDPDAPVGNWVHWVVYNIPAEMNGLQEGVPTDEIALESLRQGGNDFGKIGYGGPAPPPGKPHRYIFTLYALDTQLNLNPGASKEDLLQAMQGQTLDEAKLIGMYGR